MREPHRGEDGADDDSSYRQPEETRTWSTPFLFYSERPAWTASSFPPFPVPSCCLCLRPLYQLTCNFIIDANGKNTRDREFGVFSTVLFAACHDQRERSNDQRGDVTLHIFRQENMSLRATKLFNGRRSTWLKTSIRSERRQCPTPWNFRAMNSPSLMHMMFKISESTKKLASDVGECSNG